MLETVTPEQENESFATQEAIAAALQRYIDGARSGDGGLMRRAFTETAQISGTYSGKHVKWTVEEFCAIIEKGGPAEDLEARIIANEYAGGAGMARLRHEIGAESGTRTSLSSGGRPIYGELAARCSSRARAPRTVCSGVRRRKKR
jgi:Putative lumazine-binding